MTQKEKHLETIIDTGVVAVVRTESSEELMDVISALHRGGLAAIEITMTTPDAIAVISEASHRFKEDFILGVGSVLDPETARMAILAGAQFVVSPILNRDVITMAKRYSKIAIPGAFTPTEILTAWEAGADVVKVFPATKLGPEFFKDIRGPLPQVRLSPTGGVSLENAGDFIKAGACFLGVGSALVDRKLIKAKDWDGLAERGRRFLDAVRAARAELG